MYVCFSITLYLLLETKEDRLANDSDIQIDAVADGLAKCMWTLRTLMKLNTERQMDLPIKQMTRWMQQQRDLLFAHSQPF